MGQLRSRSRSFLQDFGQAKWWGRYDPGGSTDCKFVTSQTTDDSTLTGWNYDSIPLADKGGPFRSVLFEHSSTDLRCDVYGMMAGYRFVGPQFARYSSLNTMTSGAGFGVTPDPSDLDSKGTTAISRCSPVNPHAAVFNTVGELRRDGLPAIPALEAFQKGPRPAIVAGEYLNMEFGWKPLLSDLHKFVTSARDSNRILEQYVRDGGRPVRRRFEFPSSVETTTTVDAGNAYLPVPLMPSYCYGNTASNVRTTVVDDSRRTWFSGSFTYKPLTTASEVEQLKSTLRMANHLYGVLPTPEALWDLTPWTWAADWVANTGDVLSNISNFLSDGLVMNYGYVMDLRRTHTTISSRGATTYQGQSLSCTQELTYTRKLRRAATPFGFGLLETDFTPRQLAILASLGMTQSGRFIAK